MNEPETAIRKQSGNRIRTALLATAAVAFFVLFGYWSGVPQGENAPTFWTGVAVLVLVLAIFAWATWYLLFSPLPKGPAVRELPIPAVYVQGLALLLAMGQFAVIVGAFWDETWHRQYGIPFGEDFFWRPHVLLYIGIGSLMAMAFAALVFLWQWGQGSIRQRFRSNPIVGLLILAGGLLLYVLPADPIWHAIYGEDLSAWSIPHLMLFLGFDAIMLLAIVVHMARQPRRETRPQRWLTAADALPLWMFATLSLSWNQFFTTEWDGGARFAVPRPEWLLPLLIAGGAAFIGVMANRTLRRTGAATVSGLLALGLRFVLIQLFQVGSLMRANAWVLAMPSLILIDLWYLFGKRWWVGASIATAAGMLGVLSIFPGFYPNNPIANLPMTLAIVTAAILGLSWLGAALGDYLAEGNKQEEVAGGSFRSQLISLVVVAVFVGFVIFFVISATPPV